AQVDFRDHHPVVAPEHFAQVLRERVEETQVCLGDPGTTAPYPAYPGGDGPVRAAPAQHEDLGGAGRVVDLQRRDVLGDGVGLALPCAPHQVVVGGRVGDVTGLGVFFDASDAVFEPGGARDRPRAGQGLLVTLVGQETAVVPVGFGSEARNDLQIGRAHV